jgi:hypothetical protein
VPETFSGTFWKNMMQNKKLEWNDFTLNHSAQAAIEAAAKAADAAARRGG